MGSILSPETKNIYADGRMRNIKSNSSDRTVLEDINKLSQQELQYEFEKIYKSSSRNLHPTVFINPCENLRDAIKTCSIQNPQDLSRCFEDMQKYRQCIYRYIHDRLDVYTEGKSDRPYYKDELKLKDLTDMGDDKSQQ